MTRALSSLFHGDLQTALSYNPRVVLVAGLLLFYWIPTLWRLYLLGVKQVGRAGKRENDFPLQVETE